MNITTKIIVYCRTCRKKMIVTKSLLKRGRSKYCSRKCYYKSLAGKPLSCSFRKNRIVWNKGIKTGIKFWLGKKRPDISMEKHFNWKGGKSFEKYSLKWTKDLKKMIRERDGYLCVMCGKKQKKRECCVHHIDYNKLNCNPDNLITLCISCHIKTNYNRLKWVKYFNRLLKI